LLHRLDHLSDEEEDDLHREYLWIMESLKSKILDLERYERQKRGSVKESRETYLSPDDSEDSADPTWPFAESDYS